MSSVPDLPLHPVPLQELKHLEAGRHWLINQQIAGLDSLTPVRGQLHATHRGTVLEVEGEADTIVTLCCDRCLQHFNHPLRASSRELLWIGEPATTHATATSDPVALEGEGDDGGVMEQLDPRGSFDPEHWIFEQLNLQLPIVNHCGSDCPGPATWTSDTSGIDPRWQALQGLRS
ncbi:YceD family protein [Cyanobium sp. Aljojuca 7D2]|uniref:YceD family protein n=1 Tax=Cyanobium sp. Aljojuca 7D2 TaxID=2823698 RepID=UPI0020CCDED2|nr:YceD family protein [Cyanobium sp. Aljojuca 7D2]